jgi:4-amino-4-deoxy-L-arabinose transferase-like glycosyltransferase
LGVVAMLHIGRGLFNLSVGIFSAILLMLIPTWWLTSGMALSDVLGLALPLVACALWVNTPAKPHWGWSAGAALIAGLSLGIRPHNALVLIVFGVLALWTQRQYLARFVSVSVVFGLVGCLLWAIPMLQAVGGFEAYLGFVRGHSQHVLGVDSLIGNQMNTLTQRAQVFSAGLIAVFGGSGVLVVVCIVLAIVGVWQKKNAVWWVLVWLVLVTGKLFVLESLERPRLYLPLLPPLILLVACGLWCLQKPAWLSKISAVGLSIGLALVALPLVNTLRQERSAPEQASAYVRETYAPQESAIITFGSYRAVQYALNDYHTFYMIFYEANFWQQDIGNLAPRYLVMFDRDEIWAEAYANIIAINDYVPIDERTFTRNPLVFPQHSTLRLQILTPLSQVTPEQLRLSSEAVITLASDSMGKYLGTGWYRAEEIGGVAARWTNQNALMRVTLPNTSTRLIFNATPFGEAQQVSVWLNGVFLGEVALEGVWQTYELPIPADALVDDINKLEFRHANASIPDGSTRELSVAYQWVRFE